VSESAHAAAALSGRRGFTLLEVSVAIAILGLVLMTMMQVISGGLTLEYKAGQRGRAVVRARALMDELMTELELPDSDEDGVDADGIRWNRVVRAATLEEGTQEGDEDFEIEHDFALRYMEVKVAWDEGSGEKTYSLKSLRVTPALE